jgi:L-asparagine transporter-like permease
MGFAIEYDTSALAHKDEGYRKSLKPRQLQMIAIGTGLFMGAGGCIPPVPASSSCGALGELVLHRPSSGSVVSYARELLGEKAASRPGVAACHQLGGVPHRRVLVRFAGATDTVAAVQRVQTGHQPFVTFFSSIGVLAAGDIVNFVVLTAALSSLNAGLYSTGRILHHRDLPDPAVPVVKAQHPAVAVVPALRHPRTPAMRR